MFVTEPANNVSLRRSGPKFMRKQCARDVYLPLNKSYLRVSNIKNFYFRTTMTPPSSSPWWPFRSFPPHQSRPRARNVSLCVCKLAYHRKQREPCLGWKMTRSWRILGRPLKVPLGVRWRSSRETTDRCAVRPDYITFFFDLLRSCFFFFKVLKSLVWLLRNNIYSKLEKTIAPCGNHKNNAAYHGLIGEEGADSPQPTTTKPVVVEVATRCLRKFFLPKMDGVESHGKVGTLWCN